MSSSSSSMLRSTTSRSHSTLSPYSSLSSIFTSTSAKASYAERSSSWMSSGVLKTVPKDIGMTVWCFITVSLTRSCARMLWRVGSCTSSGVSETTAARSL